MRGEAGVGLEAAGKGAKGTGSGAQQPHCMGLNPNPTAQELADLEPLT